MSVLCAHKDWFEFNMDLFDAPVEYSSPFIYSYGTLLLLLYDIIYPS